LFLGFPVTKIMLSAVSGKGLTGNTVGIHAEWGGESHALIAKLLAPDSVHAPAFHQEITFYHHIAPQLRVALPHCYAAQISSTHDRAILILARIPGTHPLTGLDGTQARQMSRYLGQLHQQTSGMTRWRTVKWPLEAARRFRDTIKTWARPSSWPPDGERLLSVALDRLPEAYVALREPVSLVHFDIHTSNLIVQPTGSVVLLDWQDTILAHPALDIGMTASMLAPGADRVAWAMHHFEENHHDPIEFIHRTRDAVSLDFVFKLAQANKHPSPSSDDPSTEWGRAIDNARQFLL
jgi:Ser/Thr protein kinase RdoA (MazF antagonist)